MRSSQNLQKKNDNSISFQTDRSQMKLNDEMESKENKEQKEQKIKAVNFFKLYKYADKCDYFLLVIGVLLSTAAGCGLPFFAISAGNMVDAFQSTNDEMIEKTADARNQFLYIGAATFVASFFSVIVWMRLGENVSQKCRNLYLKSIFKKDLKEYQKYNDNKTLEETELNFLLFKEALGYKVGTFIFIAASLVAGGRNSMSTGWLLSCIMIATLPLLGISGVMYTFFVQLKKNKMLKYYKNAEERSRLVLQNLQGIKVLNGQKHELQIYDQLCDFSRKKVIVYSSLVGLSAGWFSLVQFGVYALAFWFGSHCIEGTSPCYIHDNDDRYTPGAVIIIFFAFYVRLDSMQQILPTLRKIYAGMQAGYKIYELIETEDRESTESLQQNLSLQDKTFHYKNQFKNTIAHQIQEEDRILKNYKNQIIIKTLPYIKQYKALFGAGLFFSFLLGILYPIFTIFLADILLQTFKFKNQPEQTSFIRQNVQRPVLVIVYIGLSSLIFNFIENSIFYILTQKLKCKLRNQSYRKLLHLPRKWYNQSPLHEPFNCVNGLRQNPSQIVSILTVLLPILFKNLVSIISGLIIAFVFQWRSALLGIIVPPMMMASGFLLMKFFNQNDTKTKNKYRQVSDIFLSAINKFKTLKVKEVEQLYSQRLIDCRNSAFLRSGIVGLKFGFSQFFIFLSFMIMFYFGSLFLKSNPEDMTVLSLFTAIFAVIWPGWTSGSNFFRVPDFQISARASAHHFNIMDSMDEKESQILSNSKLLKLQIISRVQFKEVKIQQKDQIFTISNLKFEVIERQRRIWFVSCDKKLFLILTDCIFGFKSIIEGEILINDQNLKNYAYQHLRNQISVISDEPFIFQGTIRENLEYNLEDKQKKKVDQIWSFIEFLQSENQNQPTKKSTFLCENNAETSQTEDQIINLQRKLQQKEKLSQKLAIKISLARAFLKKSKFFFIFAYQTGFSSSFYQKILSNNQGQHIRQVCIFQSVELEANQLQTQYLCKLISKT